jgi:hypothetical protein
MLSIDDDVLRRARIRALERGQSVNALVRAYLEEFAGGGPGAAGLQDFLALAERTGASSGPGRRSWSRGDLYDA